MDRVLTISNELSSKLVAQRDKFLNHIFDLVKTMSSSIGYKTLTGAVREAITGFQMVHVLSFISMKNYVSKEEIATLTKRVYQNICDSDSELIRKYIERYTELKNQKLEEQMRKFAEDISVSIGLGIIATPAFLPLAFEFLYRNWSIAAMVFNDQIVAKEMAEEVKNLHEKFE